MKAAAGAFLVLLLAGCTPTDTTTISGRFSPDRPVSLANLTVVDGRYRVSYTMAIFVMAQGAPVAVTCDVLDVSGRLAALSSLDRTITANHWVRLTEMTVVELPDATLGVRCFPDRTRDLTVVVRDLKLVAEPVP
ncbi:MAG: hypothetical protein ACKVOG_07585 [Rhodoglobus sp.]